MTLPGTGKPEIWFPIRNKSFRIVLACFLCAILMKRQDAWRGMWIPAFRAVSREQVAETSESFPLYLKIHAGLQEEA
jgi:hypothetical protein